MLRRLCDGVDGPAVVPHRDQVRRRRQIAVPDVVANGLEMPEPLAGRGLKRDQRVRVEVVAGPVRAVEVRRRRIRSARRRCRGLRRAPCPAQLFAPPLYFHESFDHVSCPGFAGMRNGVERPAQLAGPRVVGSDVAGRRGQAFRYASADDQQIAVDDRRASSGGWTGSADRGRDRRADRCARRRRTSRSAFPVRASSRIHVGRDGDEQATVLGHPSNT